MTHITSTTEELKRNWAGTGMHKVLIDVSYSSGEKTLHIDVADYWLEVLEREKKIVREEVRKDITKVLLNVLGKVGKEIHSSRLATEIADAIGNYSVSLLSPSQEDTKKQDNNN